MRVKRMLNKVLFSSDKSEWETPQWLFDELNEEFGFTLDVCASAENHKCARYFDIEADGLKQDWSGDVCWMNPPYGREIIHWVKKAYEESLKGATVVCLLPVRTCTKWFHGYVYHKAEIRFLEGRLRFVGAENSAPFPSMIAIFRGDADV